MADVVTLQDVTMRYGRQLALHNISGVFHQGSLTSIAGPNGAGKSTLLKLIAGIVKPQSGKVTVAGDQTLAFLPQSTMLQRDFPLSVLQAVCTGFWPKLSEGRAIDTPLRERARQALAEVGLAGFENRRISDLSGGQFQRLLFARVVVQDASLILLDEPFAAVDGETTGKLIQILLNWHKEGRTVICVLHDLLLIQKYFPDSFVLAGKCLGHGHTHKMLEQKLLSYDLDMAELCAGPETEGHHHHNHD